jgi:hypothetical protein
VPSRHNEDERSQLITKLQGGEGTLAEAEAWLARLRDIDPYFSCTDGMHHLEVAVKGRRLFEQMVAELGSHPSREQLVALVQRIMGATGSEEEQHADRAYLRASVADPQVLDYIYWPPDGKEMSAEEVIDRALAYRPIEL